MLELPLTIRAPKPDALPHDAEILYRLKAVIKGSTQRFRDQHEIRCD